MIYVKSDPWFCAELCIKQMQKQGNMKNINNEAPVRFTKSIVINASVETVWSVLTDINNWSTWQSDIKQSHLNGELKPHASFDWSSGGVKIHSTLQNLVPMKHFGWTGKSMGIYAIHNWALSENGEGTMLKVEESMEGLLAKLLKKPLNKKLEASLQLWLDLMKGECEMRMQGSTHFKIAAV